MTRLPSLELGIEGGRQAGSCDSGYSCLFQQRLLEDPPRRRWGKRPIPRTPFERLFGAGDDTKAREERNFYRKSILDFGSQRTPIS